MGDAMRSSDSGRELAALGTATGRWRCWQHRCRPGAGKRTTGGGRLRRSLPDGSGPDTPDRAAERARSWHRPSSREERARAAGRAPAGAGREPRGRRPTAPPRPPPTRPRPPQRLRAPDAEADVRVLRQVARHPERPALVARVGAEELDQLAPLRRRAPGTKAVRRLQLPSALGTHAHPASFHEALVTRGVILA